MRKLLAITTTLFASVILRQAHEVPFATFVKNPSKFDHQRITLIGFLEVGGSENGLWESPDALRHADLKRIVMLYYPPSRPSFSGTNYPPDIRADRHWVRVTGIAHAVCYGRLNWKEICMEQEKIEVLSGPPSKGRGQ
ncbi:MAG: hypothetical protein ACREIF_02455 [Chthoniobacterales bacterium]